PGPDVGPDRTHAGAQTRPPHWPSACTNAPGDTDRTVDGELPADGGGRQAEVGRGIALAVGAVVPYACGVPDGRRQGQNGGHAVASPSSSGLGLRPFKAAARVRIPLGARYPSGCKVLWSS